MEDNKYLPDTNSNVNSNGLWYKHNIADNILTKKYYHDDELEVHDSGDVDKAFSMFVNRVCSMVAPENKLFLADSLYKGDYILAGRSLYSAGSKGQFKSSVSNCYILPKPKDNIESIFDVAKYMARIFSYGGGCGLDISDLRPKDAKVYNASKTSTGAVSFMNVFNTVGETIGAWGRRAALLIALDCKHPDIENFLEIKQNNDKIQMANISIKFSNEFMEAVKDNKDIQLYFKVSATGEEITKTINAKEFFTKFCKSQYDFAEPGAIFIDRVRNWNLLSGYDDYKINVSNPCVTGDTLILTDKGNIPIKDLVDKEVNVWNGYQWSKTTPKITGYIQPIKRITFSNGRYIDCTPYHKYVLQDGTRVEAKDLKIGDMIASYTYCNELYDDVKVTDIEDKGIVDIVYCMNEPLNHTFIANGVITGNCSEFFGNSFNSCNLSSINLYNFVNHPFTSRAYFDIQRFEHTVKKAVAVANNVLDYGYDSQPLDENRKCIDDWRSIGIGVFGVADMLVALGIPYGTLQSVGKIAYIMGAMQAFSFEASMEYAEKHGSFGKFNLEKTLKSSYVQNCIENYANYHRVSKKTAYEQIYQKLNKYGLANGTILSIAPTGSIAMLFRESGGVEPYYQISYERTTHTLEKEHKKFNIAMLGVEQLLKANNLDINSLSSQEIKKKFPYVVDTYDIKPKDRIDIQATMQQYVDNAISSTVNLKEEATIQDIFDLYVYAWKQGCKGITIFRDNCKRISILGKDHGATRDGKQDNNLTESQTPAKPQVKLDSITPIKRTVGTQSLWGRTFLFHTACVPKFYVTVNIKDGDIFEVFVGADKGCQANISTITRLTSLCLRSGVKVDEIVKNLNSALCPACANLIRKGDTTINKSCASCIASAIVKMRKTLNDGKTWLETTTVPKDIKMIKVDIPAKKEMLECPECHNKTLIPDGRCFYCTNCGYSKCD